jgi:acyl-CoA synthetase (AMP-forming)/AMP-acid ligase II
MDKPVLDYEPTMPNAIRRAADRFGDRDFIVMPDRRMTFAEAESASRRVAKEMLARGIGKGTRVGIQFSYSTDWVVAFFAATRIGAICLPMSSVYRPAELRKTVVHGDVDTLIVPRVLVGKEHLGYVVEAFSWLDDAGASPHWSPDAPFLRRIWVAGDSSDDLPAWAESIDLRCDGASDLANEVSDELLLAIEAQVTPSDRMCIIHTSGTTGSPKGVIHTHGAFLRHSENLSKFHGLTEDFVQFSGLPWFWIGGLVLSIGQGLVRGFQLVCLEKFENEPALDLVLAEKPHQIGMWGQLGQRFRQYVDSTGRDVSMVPAFAPRPGGPVDPELMHNSLGQTESLGPHTAPGPEAGLVLDERHRGSFGLPVPHVEHRIVDPVTGEDLAPGDEGEVIVRGYSISDGLYKLERDEAFDDDGWLHTGDLGFFRDGYLFFKGRSTEMIKTLGSNVAPREVEIVLEEFDEVGLAIVIGLDDPERGQIVAAALVPKPGTTFELDAVRAHAANQLSSYKVPHHMIVVEPDELPMLGSGKPDKLTLRRFLEETLKSAVSG